MRNGSAKEETRYNTYHKKKLKRALYIERKQSEKRKRVNAFVISESQIVTDEFIPNELRDGGAKEKTRFACLVEALGTKSHTSTHLRGTKCGFCNIKQRFLAGYLLGYLCLLLNKKGFFYFKNPQVPKYPSPEL